MIEFVRTVTFSAAHRYASSSLTEDESARAYGSLYRPPGAGHGHNFRVEASFTGLVDPQTGMIENLVVIDQWLRTVAARFDHKVLNDLPEFAGTTPTLEMIALRFFEGVAALVNNPTTSLNRIRIHEGDAAWVDYFGSP